MSGGVSCETGWHSSHPICFLKRSDQTRFINHIIPFYLMLCRFYSKVLTALLLNSSWFFLLYFDRLLSCAACSVLLPLSCELDHAHLCSPGLAALHTVCVSLIAAAVCSVFPVFSESSSKAFCEFCVLPCLTQRFITLRRSRCSLYSH